MTACVKWGCLWKPIPCNVSIPKLCALVKCLCILHNFCINERLKRQAVGQVETECDAVLGSDANSILLQGGNRRGRLDDVNNNFDPTLDRENELLDVGHHYDDCPLNRTRMQMAEQQLQQYANLPRDVLLQQLSMLGYVTHPRAMGLTTTNSAEV